MIGNQIPCKREEMVEQVCDALYRVAPNILEELFNSMPRIIADIIKAKGGASKYEFMM